MMKLEFVAMLIVSSSLVLLRNSSNALTYVATRDKRNLKKNQSNMFSNQPPPDQMCAAFMIYDFITRKMEPEVDWNAACQPLQILNEDICPSGIHLLNICTEPYKTDLNPSIRYDYCEPLFSSIHDKEDRIKCVRACVKYVSRDRGDCCKFECENKA